MAVDLVSLRMVRISSCGSSTSAKSYCHNPFSVQTPYPFFQYTGKLYTPLYRHTPISVQTPYPLLGINCAMVIPLLRYLHKVLVP